MSRSKQIGLELIAGDEDPERGLEALARFLVGLWERGTAESPPLDTASDECHSEERLDRERQLPAEPNQKPDLTRRSNHG